MGHCGPIFSTRLGGIVFQRPAATWSIVSPVSMPSLPSGLQAKPVEADVVLQRANFAFCLATVRDSAFALKCDVRSDEPLFTHGRSQDLLKRTIGLVTEFDCRSGMDWHRWRRHFICRLMGSLKAYTPAPAGNLRDKDCRTLPLR